MQKSRFSHDEPQIDFVLTNLQLKMLFYHKFLILFVGSKEYFLLPPILCDIKFNAHVCFVSTIWSIFICWIVKVLFGFTFHKYM